HEEAAFLLLEQHAAYVVAFRDGVEDHERRVGELAGDCRDGVGLEEAWRDDELSTLQRDTALTFGCRVGRTFELDDFDLEAVGFVDEAEDVILGGGRRDEHGSDQDDQFAHWKFLSYPREVSYLRALTIPTC